MKNIISEIEMKTGFVARDPELLPDTTDPEEFFEHIQPLINTGEFVGVNYEDRVEWLQANGHKVTRANLIDSTLSVKPQPEE